MIVDDDRCGYAERKFPCAERKLSFAARHPLLRGLLTIIFGMFAVVVIDIVLFKIGGVKLMENFGIMTIAVGVFFVLKGYFQMIYPPRY